MGWWRHPKVGEEGVLLPIGRPPSAEDGRLATPPSPRPPSPSPSAGGSSASARPVKPRVHAPSRAEHPSSEKKTEKGVATITLVGVVATDVVSSKVGGHDRVDFFLSVARRTKTKERALILDTFRVTAWDSLALYAQRHIARGSHVCLSGDIHFEEGRAEVIARLLQEV